MLEDEDSLQLSGYVALVNVYSFCASPMRIFGERGAMTIAKLLLLAILAVFAKARIVQPEEPRPEPIQLFFLSDDNKLWRLDISGSEVRQNIIIDDFVENYDLDLGQGALFWLDRTGRIFRRRVNDTRDEFVLQPYPALTGIRIAYDRVTDKFYMIDGESQEVDVVDSRGKNGLVLFERDPVREEHVVREKPRRLVLDPRAGLMFILTDLNGEVKKIYRCNMDGTAKKLLIPNTGGNELSVDHRRKKIYWFNGAQKVIESADYGGQNRAHVVKVHNPIDLIVYENQLFWSSEESTGSKPKSIINTCELRDGTCKDIRRIELELHAQRPHSLKILRRSNETTASNPCHGDNGSCQHLCLLTSASSSICACNSGWEPTSDDPSRCRLKRTRSRRQL